MHRTFIIFLTLILVVATVGISWTQTDEHHPLAQPPQTMPSTAPSPTPQQGSGGMMGGMAGMQMMCPMPAMAADTDALYVVRGNDIFKFSKTDLKLLAQGTIPMPQMGGMQSPQGGSMMPMQPGLAAPGMMQMPGFMMPPEMQQMMAQMQQMSSREFDKSFLQNMMRHHAGAIAMSRPAVKHAHHQELRSFAQKVIDVQSSETREFREWLREWYNTSIEVTLLQTDKEMVRRLEGLHGGDLEVQYMQDMIAHHSLAIEMARMAEQKADHPELKTTAAKIIETQSREIGQLRGWLSAWYGVTT